MPKKLPDHWLINRAGDLNETYFVGNVDEASRRLVQCTYECLEKAISIGMCYIYLPVALHANYVVDPFLHSIHVCVLSFRRLVDISLLVGDNGHSKNNFWCPLLQSYFFISFKMKYYYFNIFLGLFWK